MRSENWGGLAGLIGSALFVVVGDMGGIWATVLFLIAEVLLTRFGHKTAGYSAGCALIAIGGGALCFSGATEGNVFLKAMVGISAAVWVAGAFRYPLEVAANSLEGKKGAFSKRLKNLSMVLQPIVGAIQLILRLPTLLLSIIGGNYIMFAATCLYALSDMLMGRVHQFVSLKNAGRSD